MSVYSATLNKGALFAIYQAVVTVQNNLVSV